MTTVWMDTHEVVKELLVAVLIDGQAEAVTRLVFKAREIDAHLSRLARKGM